MVYLLVSPLTFPRRAIRLVDEALADTPIVAINGPRQVGKVHWHDRSRASVAASW